MIRRTAYDFHPSWFGGEASVRRAADELAAHVERQGYEVAYVETIEPNAGPDLKIVTIAYGH